MNEDQDEEETKRRFWEWHAAYHAEADQDEHRLLEEHLERLGEGVATPGQYDWQSDVVAACLAFRELDKVSRDGFLERQRYAPRVEDGGTYIVTLGHLGSSFARIVVRDDLKDIDFADLLGMPWDRLQSVGYDTAWISRVDGIGLDHREAEALQREIEADLWFDYAEDELDLAFEFDLDNEVLKIFVMEH